MQRKEQKTKLENNVQSQAYFLLLLERKMLFFERFFFLTKTNSSYFTVRVMNAHL